jgi:hypothetical protein
MEIGMLFVGGGGGEGVGFNKCTDLKIEFPLFLLSVSLFITMDPTCVGCTIECTKS